MLQFIVGVHGDNVAKYIYNGSGLFYKFIYINKVNMINI